MVKKAGKSLVLGPGLGVDGDTLFSNFIVVFPLQKEMRKRVCAVVGEFLPRAGTRCRMCEKHTHEQECGGRVGVSGHAGPCTGVHAGLSAGGLSRVSAQARRLSLSCSV